MTKNSENRKMEVLEQTDGEPQAEKPSTALRRIEITPASNGYAVSVCREPKRGKPGEPLTDEREEFVFSNRAAMLEKLDELCG